MKTAMAGTNRTHDATPPSGAPEVVLVRPQLGENIGTAARAMLNCGLTRLRLVAPRDGWPNPSATATASGANVVLEKARVFPTLAEAVADCHYVYATTARPRGMVKPVVTPRHAMLTLRARERRAARERTALVMGPERTGLTNNEVALCDTIVEVPLNPAFASLNLAQAVLILAYEWYQTGLDPQTLTRVVMPTGDSRPARRAELMGLFRHLERELDGCGFLRVREKRPGMVRTLRNLLHRARLTEQEVRTLRGVVACLSERGRSHPVLPDSQPDEAEDLQEEFGDPDPEREAENPGHPDPPADRA